MLEVQGTPHRKRLTFQQTLDGSGFWHRLAGFPLIDTCGCALTLMTAFSRINLLIRLFKAQPVGGWNDAAAIGQSLESRLCELLLLYLVGLDAIHVSRGQKIADR